jgi:hypothetical protein
LVKLHLSGQFLVLAHLLLAFHVPADDLLEYLFLLVNLVRRHGHAVTLHHSHEVLWGHLSIGVHLVEQVLRQGWCLNTSTAAIVLGLLFGFSVFFYPFENGVVFFFLLVILLLLVLMGFDPFVDWIN